ncbi:MAG TPA: ROK family transcriptional regulator [Nocardioides sp.]|nr:ROK family transcriptional regulator [Nocardioides sp.]
MAVTQLPAHHAGMRASNLGLTLGAIADAGPLTRAQVAARTGLTKSSVSGLAADLIAGGLVTEAPERAGPDRGRPGTGLSVAANGAGGLGLEINVDYLAALVVDLSGVPRYRHLVSRDNRQRSPGEVLGELGELADSAVQSAREQGLPLAGVCLAVPGQAGGGVIVRAPNLGWSDVDVALPLPPTPLPTTIDNEANLAALGELWADDVGPDFIHVSGEVGIGAGIVVGGELFRGVHGRAGEFGHVVMDADGPPCSCGGRGCLERLAGQEAILAAAGVSTRAELKDRCQAGDAAALAAVAAAGVLLGQALASATNLLDPEAIVLGGTFADLGPWLRSSVEESLARHGTRPRLLISGLGTEAAVHGAAGSVIRRVLKDPASYMAGRAVAREA